MILLKPNISNQLKHSYECQLMFKIGNQLQSTKNINRNKSMKKSILTPVLLVVLLMATNVKAQMGIGTATPHSSAQLDVSSVLKGFLAPRMTFAQRNAVATPAEGLLVYQTDSTPGFYYYNGTAWVALSGSGGGSGVDLTTNQSVGGKKTFTSNDGLLATSANPSSGVASSLGAGTRMMWYPKKAAFRVGEAIGTEWDDANIGLFSVAMGLATKASGHFSTAMGYSTIASAQYSTAMGNSTIASAQFSTAMGSTTRASGEYSTAMGNGTTASNTNSTAMGYSSIASQQFSTAMGYGTTASGIGSSAMGMSTTASGQAATAMGQSTLATQTSSTAMGFGPIASGVASTAMGYYTTAKSLAETAIGTYNTDYSPTNGFLYNATERLFVIGNGTSSSALSDALVMLKNGNTTFSGTVTATVVAPTSDARLKRNIVPLKNSIEAIMKLKPVSYEKKNSLTSTDYNIKENGFIAQELQKVMPSLVVMGTDKDKLLSVNYTAIIPVLTQAIQEQQKQIAELKKMVEQLMKK